MEAVNIYLAALLEHIPNKLIQETFESLNERPDILKLANQYASAGNFNPEHSPDFVASPFENLKKSSSEYAYRFPLQKLSLKRDFFPKKKDEITEEDSADTLWESFAEDFQNRALSENLERSAERTLNLLAKYAVAIPNPAGMYPEISWYDYVKTKSGMALSVLEYTEHKGSTEIKNDESPLLIIRADVSGIQNFIGAVASKNASKNLKGRSFYVQLLADVVLRKMLKGLGLFQGNVLYASGGNFFIIAPNIPRVRDAFVFLKKEIERAIFNEHGTGISIVMGYQEVTQSQILEGNINEAIQLLFEQKIDVLKRRKYADLIASDYERFFTPVDVGGRSATDVVTGEEIVDNEKVYYLDDNKALPQKATQEQRSAKQNLIKEGTAKQILLGHSLRNAEFLAVFEEPDKVPGRTEVVMPCHLGVAVSAMSEYPFGASEVWALNKIDASQDVDGFMLYGGNRVPVLPESYTTKNGEERRKGDPTYFHEMSAKGYYKTEKQEGVFKRLGVLRMDIDGLGGIFKNYLPYPSYSGEDQKGAKRKHLSFAMYAALSRNLDWFFKGYLNEIWKEDEEFKNYTQIIYSGGDDLFIIGRWDLTIAFAERIKEDFTAFTCGGGLTISGGIAIITDKYPILKAGMMASEAEHKAKSHELKGGENKEAFSKNSITLLGKPLHWDTEYLLVKKLKDDLLKYLSKDREERVGIPRSLLGKIRAHHYLMRKFEADTMEGLKVNPRWLWLATYDFSRFIGRLRSDQAAFIKRLEEGVQKSGKEVFRTASEAQKNHDAQIAFLDKLKIGIFTNRYEDDEGKVLNIESKYHFLELLNLAARWAELALRSDFN